VRFVGELLLLGLCLSAYKWVRLVTRDDVGTALHNARRVIGLERALNVATELDLQRWVLASTDLIQACNHYYVRVHFPSMALLLLWALFLAPEHYRHLRRVVIATTALSLVAHVAFPLAPPRMLTSLGFIDTMARYGPDAYGSETIRQNANQFAAMPSVHFAWAVIAAYAIIRFTRSRWRWLAVAHPVATLFVIVATANHYWLDAFVAGALVGLVLVVEAWAARRRAGPGTLPYAEEVAYPATVLASGSTPSTWTSTTDPATRYRPSG
jgi:hypothetical protein